MDECTLNDLLECSICLDRLDTSSKVLPCQHTFCKKCLEEIVTAQRELRCPECRVLVNVKVEDLPPNVLLMRILEGMRNAIPKVNKTLHRSNNVPQRLQGGHQVSPTSPTVTPNTPLVIVSSESTTPQAAKQINHHNRPYGRAIYDYVSKVAGDLSFKKGDIVILRKKIDNNWYFGECGPNHGVFPLSYVQVMTPLPPHVPQCKALYDFRMNNDEEDGCLTFNKGEIISVIRRVDENWAEGKLLDRIGIFPLAFVEMNSVARALMKLSTNVQPGPSRVAPPTPTNEETTPLIPTDHSRTVQASVQPRQIVASAPALPISELGSNVSSGDSSTTTSSPIMTSTSSSNSSTTPSSPCSPAVSPPTVANRHSTKRHSFTGINNSHQVNPQHRHSAEILSMPDDEAAAAGNNSASAVTENSGYEQIEPPAPRHKRSGSSDLVLSSSTSMTSSAPAAIAAGLNLPAPYIAIYPYKPQKADELELRKGGIYVVTERCQDGWFKGTSNRTQKCGVFPGNYVAPAKCQRLVCRLPGGAAAAAASGGASPSSTGAESKKYPKAQAPVKSPPPELPPRALSPAPVPWPPRQLKSLNPLKSMEQSPQAVASAPSPSVAAIARSVMPTMFTSPGKSVNSTASGATTTTTTPARDSGKSPKNVAQSPSASAATSAVASTSAPPVTPKSTEKVKEKKEKGVSLMRRLTNIKKSKSPPPSTYSMDNPVFDDGNTGQSSSSINPIHIRSGEPAGLGATMSSHHRKSHSLDAGSSARRPALREFGRERIERVHRFRCIVPYPPNSEFELELQIGDIIYVHKRRDDGWYKGTQQRTGRTGLFPASFVEAF
ncbi:SH3 domain-containing RING finger protein 3 isoform X3 [Trichogramma pretiosum]|uniref:SH3 domain-containing RING finger protein 3 isoform X3 n=1 Tax=Trichogramma pretiosum TaxID=7493 RepID=UPI0006C9CC80|nr:SH3 domain-containing RING finger protein 3 isoform X3 [Trichogramma pretiosum]